ncbi:hypothetical protein [Kocuria palustris]|uniref:hypothetical protein n=1 Tax=Kocuria palustris TaxID=71999 RepID=UPI0011A2D408|nr:hypothetical protein [Kocuria palustris]
MAQATPAHSPDRSGASRRTVLTAAAWSTPVIALAAQAPAMALSPASTRLGVVFDGGGGSNGYFNSAYLNLRSATGAPLTLAAPVTLTIDVVGLNPKANDERSMTFGSSNGTIGPRTYNRATHTTTFTWTVPAGTVVPTARRNSSNPDILFTFRDGASNTAGAGRITNKIVVRSITGGTLVEPSGPPIDSSVVHDESGVSPDGIY